jgi:hypothetical protein
MKIRRLVVSTSLSVVALALGIGGILSAQANAEGEREHAARHKGHAGELVRIVRDATKRYLDVRQAEAEGYGLLFGCVSGPDDGAMGLHYVNMALVSDPVLDPRRPEIVIYEPLPNGGRRLIGADFLVFADAWHATNTGTPQVMGQLMHLIDSPNRYGLPAFYTLHVWAWKPSPTGAFVNWHADVSCENFENAQD